MVIAAVLINYHLGDSHSQKEPTAPDFSDTWCSDEALNKV